MRRGTTSWPRCLEYETEVGVRRCGGGIVTPSLPNLSFQSFSSTVRNFTSTVFSAFKSVRNYIFRVVKYRT